VAPTAWGRGIKKAGNALLVWENIKTLEDVHAEDKAGKAGGGGEKAARPAAEPASDAGVRDRAAAEAAGEGVPEGGVYQKNGVWIDADGKPVEGAV